MKIMRNIIGLRPTDIGDAAFEKLEVLSPESVTVLWDGRKKFGGLFDENGEEFDLICAVLAGAGHQVVRSIDSPSTEKVVRASSRKVYEHNDLDGAPAVVLKGNRSTMGSGGDCKQEEGESPVEMPYELIDGDGDESHMEDPITEPMAMAGPYMNRLLVMDPVKRIIEAGGFGDAKFYDVLPYFQKGKKRNHYDWSSFDDIHWWELASDRRMPPMSPSMHLFAWLPETNAPGRIEPGRPGFWRAEPQDGILPAELHYRRSDFESMGEFDLAETAEGGGDRRHRKMICSVRFFKHLLEHGYEPGFIPVRLDED